jgi:pimeloyl-ACP methyl ester carboxylesterase
MPVYRPSAGTNQPDCFLGNARPGQRAIVVIHGISRNAAELTCRFASHPGFCDATIIAPVFDRQRFGKYQQLLADRPGAVAADEALLALLGSLAEELQLPAGPVGLFGFSGGAQMAHRFAMVHPGTVHRLCLASAGWYTMPQDTLPWPYGTGEGSPLADTSPRYLTIPTTVIVGERDTRIDSSVRQDALILQHQGPHRLARARAWVDAMQHRARQEDLPPQACLFTLPDVSHDFGQSVGDGRLLDLAAAALA